MTFLQDPISAGLLALAVVFLARFARAARPRRAARSAARMTARRSGSAALARRHGRRRLPPGRPSKRRGKLFLDVAGLVHRGAARAVRRRDARGGRSAGRGGPCTALGHAGGFDAFGAALVNGTAAHGEDLRRHVRRRAGAFGRRRSCPPCWPPASAKGLAAIGCSSAS